MKIPVLFVHGFGGDKREYQAIIDFLKKHNYEKFYSFEYKNNLGQVSLKNIAEELDGFIKQNVSERELNIVGISQGGVIARHYINNLMDRTIRKCATICTPHHGSLLAYFLGLPGFKDLRFGSDFLKDLDQKEKGIVEYYTVHNPLDLMVFPYYSAIFEKAVENKKVWSILHPTTFREKETLDFILRVFA